MASYSINALNQLDQSAFVTGLAAIYEHSPWVAEYASLHRPYATVASLASAMRACVEAADRATQLRLIRAHPELAGKLAVSGELTAASLSEQVSAGLNNCSEAEFAHLTELNRIYQAKFDFPFIVAVRGMSRADIIAAMEKRVMNTIEQEIDTALNEIGRIAGFRLRDLIAD